MINSVVTVSLATAALVLVSDVNAKGKWERHGKEEGISVFTTNHPKSEVPEVKAVTTINAPTPRVWEYVTETIKIDGLKEHNTIDSCGNGCDYVYVRLGNWMIKDRHYVVKVNWQVTDVDGYPQYVRRWTKTNERKPVNPKGIPVRNVQGSWTLTPIDGGKRTRITYINHLDLGGSVPPSLFSRGFVSNAYDILKNIRNNA
ncbi:MAG: hypothetical protein JXX14_25870 [Deltaproteobacteria bacterium]|nr:hypothetical protein [Deltaproteobacteria bacterium]